MGTIRVFDLDEIKKKCNISTFVETGTLYGDSVDYALGFDFKKIISIEIDNSLAEKAIHKYRNEPRVEIIEGDSVSVIKSLAVLEEGNVLWWLDAHFPGADAGLAPYDADIPIEKKLPLYKELETLSKRINKYKDVIICDDLWIFEEGPFESGDFDLHCARHGQNMTRASFKGHMSLADMIKSFENTHNVKKLYQNNGYTVLLPK